MSAHLHNIPPNTLLSSPQRLDGFQSAYKVHIQSRESASEIILFLISSVNEIGTASSLIKKYNPREIIGLVDRLGTGYRDHFSRILMHIWYQRSRNHWAHFLYDRVDNHTRHDSSSLLETHMKNSLSSQYNLQEIMGLANRGSKPHFLSGNTINNTKKTSSTSPERYQDKFLSEGSRCIIKILESSINAKLDTNTVLLLDAPHHAASEIRLAAFQACRAERPDLDCSPLLREHKRLYAVAEELLAEMENRPDVPGISATTESLIRAICYNANLRELNAQPPLATAAISVDTRYDGLDISVSPKLGDHKSQSRPIVGESYAYQVLIRDTAQSVTSLAAQTEKSYIDVKLSCAGAHVTPLRRRVHLPLPKEGQELTFSLVPYVSGDLQATVSFLVRNETIHSTEFPIAVAS